MSTRLPRLWLASCTRQLTLAIRLWPISRFAITPSERGFTLSVIGALADPVGDAMATESVSHGHAGLQRHPPGLYVLFATEMWERFSFYSMLAMFTLYLRDADEGFGWTASEATTLYSNYLMFVYASPLVGGKGVRTLFGGRFIDKGS